MKNLFLLLILALSVLSAFSDGLPEAVEKEGVFRFSDGISIYSFHKDGSFDLNPCSMSGRTIKGNWKEVDGFIQVEGKWSWVNGLSAPSDIRIMKLQVNTHPSFGKDIAGINKLPVHKVHFTIESICKKTKPSKRSQQ